MHKFERNRLSRQDFIINSHELSRANMEHTVSQRQLTVRATIAGMLLGGVMSLSNLYIALKTGWSFGVTITAGILAFVIFGLLKKARLVRVEFGMLENNAMQSVASAAGYMTGGGTVAAIPALM